MRQRIVTELVAEGQIPLKHTYSTSLVTDLRDRPGTPDHYWIDITLEPKNSALRVTA